MTWEAEPSGHTVIGGWGAMLAEALRQSGGPLTDDELAWADDVLGTRTRPAA